MVLAAQGKRNEFEDDEISLIETLHLTESGMQAKSGLTALMLAAQTGKIQLVQLFADKEQKL